MTTYADLPVHVTRDAAEPLSVQIARQIRDAVGDGILAGGERLPSSRELAGSLGVSRTVVTAAYTQLFAEGWLEGRHGSGTYAADVTPAPAGSPFGAYGPISAARSGAKGSSAPSRSCADGRPSAPIRGAGDRGSINLRPGIPWVAGIDPAMWRRAFRYAGTQAPSAWPDPAGLGELRAEVAGYLRRVRALAVSPGQVVITRGVAGGLALLAAEVVRPGDRVGVEEPGYPSARLVLARAEADVVPCRADADGLVVNELPGDLRLVYTTPAHQYPLGGRLPVRRRQALIAWARRTGALIVEDDYDSEFRYDVAPLPSLCGMDPEVVVYLGTASKVLAPSLGAGWLVTGSELAGRLAQLRGDLGERIPEPVQYAVLAMLRSGDLARHVRRMRREYASRREVVTSALAGAGGRLLGDTAGLHVVLKLPGQGAVTELIEYARARGVTAYGIDRYFAGPVTTPGLIVGYGPEPLFRIRQAVDVLAAGLGR
jgi:GntR family transcriptional regulator/MocR family aminotransferase